VEHRRAYPANVFVANLGSARLHWHFDYELMVILKGSLQVFCGPEPYGDNNIQDEDLAESTIKHFKINEKTLYCYLKGTTGQSLKGLINAARIEKAK
jgi:AraC-like DNA-binding protein